MQIAEVAKRYGISVDTIRYYERIGLVPHVTRLPNGIRDFAEYDCGWVEFIRCMRESGVQIEARCRPPRSVSTPRSPATGRAANARTAATNGCARNSLLFSSHPPPNAKGAPLPGAPFNASGKAVDTTRCDPSPRVVSPSP